MAGSGKDYAGREIASCQMVELPPRKQKNQRIPAHPVLRAIECVLHSTTSKLNSVETCIAFKSHAWKASTFVMAKPNYLKTCRENATSEIREK